MLLTAVHTDTAVYMGVKDAPIPHEHSHVETLTIGVRNGSYQCKQQSRSNDVAGDGLGLTSEEGGTWKVERSWCGVGFPSSESWGTP